MNTAELSLQFASSFEGELLVELMLRYWNHPNADNTEFRNELIEIAAQVLNDSIAGQSFIEDLKPASMNFVAAIWIAESNALASPLEPNSAIEAKRRSWLIDIRKAIPSCFVDPEGLP